MGIALVTNNNTSDEVIFNVSSSFVFSKIVEDGKTYNSKAIVSDETDYTVTSSNYILDLSDNKIQLNVKNYMFDCVVQKPISMIVNDEIFSMTSFNLPAIFMNVSDESEQKVHQCGTGGGAEDISVECQVGLYTSIKMDSLKNALNVIELPTGLKWNKDNGVISGSPSIGGTFKSFIIQSDGKAVEITFNVLKVHRLL